MTAAGPDRDAALHADYRTADNRRHAPCLDFQHPMSTEIDDAHTFIEAKPPRVHRRRRRSEWRWPSPALAATFMVSPEWPNYLLVASLAVLALGLTVRAIEGRGSVRSQRHAEHVAGFDRHLSQQRTEAVTLRHRPAAGPMATRNNGWKTCSRGHKYRGWYRARSADPMSANARSGLRGHAKVAPRRCDSSAIGPRDDRSAIGGRVPSGRIGSLRGRALGNGPLTH